jgi:dsRNA-specific ribonuclease
MTEAWQHQVRIYLPEDLARLARKGGAAEALRPLAELLAAHDARAVSQLDAFESYLAAVEGEGGTEDPLYRWTKATLEDPAKRLKHMQAFSLHVGGSAVYPKAVADALEAALQPLLGGGIVTRLSRHDTNPATNMPVPPDYRRGEETR